MFDWVTFQGFTCVEWGVIISSFGKFRRFAERFFIKKTALTSLVISDDIFSEFYYIHTSGSYIDGTQKFEWQHIVKKKWRRLFKRFRAFQEAFCNDSVADEIFEGSRLKAVSMMDAAIEV
ncbi:hypothetical protein V6N11_065949 [Hibiscus sabdariffa]|uniref:Uncharacterized protein n=1 Tax=Hibiscus sabdariffa TaxID=183260 RepID=A0ABR2NUT4_9ROSI